MIDEPEIPAAATPHRVAGWCGAVVMLAGAVVLFGRIFEFPLLTEFLARSVTTKANTALCFVLCGAAMWLLQMPGRYALRMARVCTVMLGVIAILTLLEHATGWNLGTDKVLDGVHSSFSGTLYRGRTGSSTAFCMALMAAALWLMNRTPGTARRPLILGCIGSYVVFIGLIALLGHLGEFQVGYGWMNFTSMAVMTASLLVLLGAGLLAVAWRGAGARWLIEPWITAGFAAGLALLVTVAAFSHGSMRNLVEAADRVSHSHEVLAKISELRSSLDEHQSGMRGFVITGNESFLPLSEKAFPQALNQVRELRELTSDNASQQRRIAVLEKQIDAQRQLVRQIIELRRSMGLAEAAAQIATGTGKAAMDAIRVGLSEMEAEEKKLLQGRAAESQAITNRTFGMLPISTVLSLIFLGSGLHRLNGVIVARKRGADALRRSDRRLKMALNAAGIGEWVMNPVTHAARRSLKHDQIFGYAKMLPEWSYEMFLEHVHPEDRGRVDQAFQESMAAGRDWEFECRIIRHDGTPGWIWARGLAVKNASGSLVEMLGMVRDITGRKEAEENLRASEAFGRSIIDSSPDCIKVTDLAGNLLSMESGQALLGIEDIRPFLNKSWIDFWGNEVDRRAAQAAVEAAAAGGTGHFVGFFRTLRGEDKWWDVAISPILDSDGKPEHLLVVSRDVTQRQQAAEALRASEERVRLALDAAELGTFNIDLPSNTLTADARFRVIFGIASGDVDYEQAFAAIHPEDRPGQRDAVAAATRTDAPVPYATEYRVVHPDGAIRWVFAKGRANFGDGEGAARRLLSFDGTVADITERKQAEEVLRQSTAQFETLVNEAPLGVLLIDADFRIRQVNPTALPVYRNIPDLIGRDYAEILHILWPEAQADAAVKQFRHTLETGEPCYVPEMIETRADRQTTEYYEWQINRIPLPDGRPGVVCYFRDISERVLAQLEIRESEKRYRTLFNSIDEGFCLIEMVFDEHETPVDYRFLEVNPAFEKQTGLHEATGKRMRELHPEHEAHWFETYGKVALTGEAIRFTNQAKALDGRWFDVYAFPLGGPGSRKIALLFNNITARKQAEEEIRKLHAELEQRAEEALRSSEGRYRTLFEYAPDGIVIADSEAFYLDANASICRMLGYTRDELIGLHSSDIVAETESEHIGPALSEIKTTSNYHREWKFRRKDGSVFDAEVIATQMPDGNLLAMIRDITGRKRTELELQQSEARLQAVTENLSEGLIISDIDGQLLHLNRASLEMHGYQTREEGLRKLHEFVETLELTTPDGIRLAFENWPLNRIYRGEVLRDVELVARRLDIDWQRILSYSGGIVHDATGKPLAFLAINDITVRKQTEEALREKEALLHATDRRLADIVHGMTEACFALDLEWRFSFVNERSEILFRMPIGALLGRTIWEVVPYLVGTPMEANYRHAMAERVPVAFEIFSPLAERWLEIRLFPTADGGLAAFALDIHARKMAETERQKFVSLAENSVEFIGMCDLEGKPFFVNEAGLRLMGLDDLAQALRTPMTEFFFPEDQAFIRDEFLPRVRREGHGEVEIRFRHFQTGEAIQMIYNVFVVLDADGKPVAFATVSRDITGRKRAEEEIGKLNTDLLGRTAKLETAVKELDAFSYSVAHDLRAPLRAVDGFSRMVMKYQAARLDDNGRRMLGAIRGETQRMGQLIDDLLAFSRLGRQQLEPAPIDMQALARGVFDELAALDPERKLRLDLHPLPPARGTQAMIRQVWVNLIANAIKFTKERETGEIEIGAGDGEDGVPVYHVKDNGAGFDMRYAGKLFGVFHRLHSQQEFPGTGVGLALVQRIVQRHGGRVWAEAEVNRGATFYFTLPNQ